MYAPEHPGTTPGEPDAVHHVDNLWDLVLCYDELLEQLRLSEVVLVGHSFGAMVACEVAALRPSRVRRLVLIDPIGLWRDDAPVMNWMLLAPQPTCRRTCSRDPDGAAAKALFAVPRGARGGGAGADAADLGDGIHGQVHLADPRQGAQEAHPPHRRTPALLVWGRGRSAGARAYADEFRGGCPDARLEVVKGAGHAPDLEQPEATAQLVQSFLKG